MQGRHATQSKLIISQSYCMCPLFDTCSKPSLVCVSKSHFLDMDCTRRRLAWKVVSWIGSFSSLAMHCCTSSTNLAFSWPCTTLALSIQSGAMLLLPSSQAKQSHGAAPPYIVRHYTKGFSKGKWARNELPSTMFCFSAAHSSSRSFSWNNEQTAASIMPVSGVKIPKLCASRFRKHEVSSQCILDLNSSPPGARAAAGPSCADARREGSRTRRGWR